MPVIAIAAVLGGCASRPAVTVSSTGTLPTAGTFTTLIEEGVPVSEHAALAADRLRARGLQPSEHGDYVLQAALARRPASAGLFDPSRPDEWLRSPARSHTARETPELVLTLSSRASGTEIYRAVAIGGPRHASERDIVQPLIDAALPEL